MTALSNVSARAHVAAAVRAVRLFAGEKHHAEVAMAKRAALRTQGDNRTGYDAPSAAYTSAQTP